MDRVYQARSIAIEVVAFNPGEARECSKGCRSRSMPGPRLADEAIKERLEKYAPKLSVSPSTVEMPGSRTGGSTEDV